ncbi:unnamed protein product [Somion occarium]
MSTSRDSSRLRAGPNSQSHSTPDVSRNNSGFIPPEAVVFPEGPISESTAEALHEFVHPHHHTDETLVEETIEEHDAEEQRKKLPWWRRPSPWWFFALIPFTAIATAATLAPRIEIYTKLICEVYKPDLSSPRENESYTALSSFPSMYDDGNQKRCAADPVVQAAVAQLNMIITTSAGIMGCLTTGWWSSLSDRYGRLWVMGISAFGLIYADVNFILVSKFYRLLPGGYWAFIVGNLVDGIMGGLPTVSAAIHAYAADSTELHGRARAFALFVGLMFFGTAVGPTIGGLLVTHTHNLLTVFYLAATIHVFYTILIWFVVPESLPRSAMMKSRRVHAERLAEIASGSQPAVSWLRRIFGFLSPLNVFMIQPVDQAQNPLKRKKRNWNLPLIGLSYGFSTLLYGSYNYKFQYTSAVWGWTSEQIGYWLSVVGATRAIYLAVIFPAIIHFFKPKARAVQLPTSPSEPLLSSSSSDEAQAQQPSSGSSSTLQSSSSSSASSHSASPSVQSQALRFDLTLARISLFIELVAFVAMPFSPNPIVFTVFTVMTCFGAGYSPAIQSVALIMYTENGGVESGKLFGAISVVQSL